MGASGRAAAALLLALSAGCGGDAATPTVLGLSTRDFEEAWYAFVTERDLR